MVIDTSKLLSGSWKTTALGLISAAAGFVAFSPNLPLLVAHPWIGELSKYIMAGGMAGIGLAAKDSAVTGGTKLNTSNDPAVTKAAIVEKEPQP